MVLYPIGDPRRSPASGEEAFVSAWDAVEETQHRSAASYWLITQPDHAALAGELAAHFVSPRFPCLEESVVRAIAVHDAGWALFGPEQENPSPPPTDASGKPLSFLEIVPEDFIRAWSASIDRAEAGSPVGGIMVSRHFCRLGRGRLAAGGDNRTDTRRLLTFLEQEAQRERRLGASLPHTQPELERLADVLQFCDLLSLYLCCGTRRGVEFPQKLGGNTVRLRHRDGAFVLHPSPFQKGDTPAPSGLNLSLQVKAWRYPRCAGQPDSTTLAFQVK
jgi:hypothetical protein